MNQIYRGYNIKFNPDNGRYYISKADVEVYSMTTNKEDDVYDWIDKDIRKRLTATS